MCFDFSALCNFIGFSSYRRLPTNFLYDSEVKELLAPQINSSHFPRLTARKSSLYVGTSEATFMGQTLVSFRDTAFSCTVVDAFDMSKGKIVTFHDDGTSLHFTLEKCTWYYQDKQIASYCRSADGESFSTVGHHGATIQFTYQKKSDHETFDLWSEGKMICSLYKSSGDVYRKSLYYPTGLLKARFDKSTQSYDTFHPDGSLEISFHQDAIIKYMDGRKVFKSKPGMTLQCNLYSEVFRSYITFP